MTVKQLKEKLNDFPDNMDVFLAERQTEYAFGLLNSVGSQDVVFDPENGEESVELECVVLSED